MRDIRERALDILESIERIEKYGRKITAPFLSHRCFDILKG